MAKRSRSTYTVHCETCEWTSYDIPNYQAAQKWAAYHRDSTRDPKLGAHVVVIRRQEATHGTDNRG